MEIPATFHVFRKNQLMLHCIEINEIHCIFLESFSKKKSQPDPCGWRENLLNLNFTEKTGPYKVLLVLFNCLMLKFSPRLHVVGKKNP